jgi:anaerobic ribonucleoside-triphosphate reductase activating protein
MLIPINNISYSTVNGPGYRYVIWVQGCKLNCKGCFNPETHSNDGTTKIDIGVIANEINSNPTIEGITISGGEPLDYAKELIELIKLINPTLTSIIFTGYTIKEIIKDIYKTELIKKIDLVLSGRYNQKAEHPFLNKKVLNITGRIDFNYFKPKTRIEYSINKDKVTKTGIFKTQ